MQKSMVLMNFTTIKENVLSIVVNVLQKGEGTSAKLQTDCNKIWKFTEFLVYTIYFDELLLKFPNETND